MEVAVDVSNVGGVDGRMMLKIGLEDNHTVGFLGFFKN